MNEIWNSELRELSLRANVYFPPPILIIQSQFFFVIFFFPKISLNSIDLSSISSEILSLLSRLTKVLTINVNIWHNTREEKKTIFIHFSPANSLLAKYYSPSSSFHLLYFYNLHLLDQTLPPSLFIIFNLECSHYK